MRHLVVLGAGTAGTVVVNKLRPRLAKDEWKITIVDQDDSHHYQPGYLFVPFGEYKPHEIVHSRQGQAGGFEKISPIHSSSYPVAFNGGKTL